MTAPAANIGYGMSLAPAELRVEQVSKRFAGAPVLQQVSLTAPAGAFISIIGPSGSGKTTLFNLIAGLEPPDSGRVWLAGDDVTGQRGLVAYMPQRDALLPWRTVLDNAVLAATVQRGDVPAARVAAARLLPVFGLEGYGDQLPAVLSGGMRQRAALLRTVMWQRAVMLLDEPFGALDALTRAALHRWLLDLWHTLERTVVLVTHDIEEAILLSDRVYVLSSRPAQVVRVVDIPLPRPRSYELVTGAAFVSLKAQLLAAIAVHV